MNIVLAAQESAGVQALRAVAASGHRLVAVLTSRSGDTGRGASVGDVAANLGVAVWPARLLSTPELAVTLRERDVDLLLNVHSLHVVHPDVLGAARIGSFNLHPGPLPQYAGLNAPSWALFRGETSHAVTVHWMTSAIDAGAIAYQAWFALGEAETGLSVSSKCVRLGLPLLERLLHDAAAVPPAIPSRRQDLRLRHYYGRDVPFGGSVHWSLPARDLVRFVRASDYHPLPSPWGVPMACLEHEPIGICGASLTGERCSRIPGSVDHMADGSVVAASGDEWVRIHSVRIGGRRVDARAALSPGQSLGDGRTSGNGR